MILVQCQRNANKKCDKAYDGCKEQVMYSDIERQILCKDGVVFVCK